MSLSDMVRRTDHRSKQTRSNNTWYYIVNLLQFLYHTYHLHPEPANKSHEKATLSRLASHQLSKPADKGPHKSARGSNN